MAIKKVGQSESFGYTGGVQEFIAPFGGLYMLEGKGAQGGSHCGWAGAGGKGGYVKVYVLLEKGQSLYIVCGGKGTDSYMGNWRDEEGDPQVYSIPGGYNGGGSGHSRETNETGNSGRGSGGGATHIAKVNRGTLNNFNAHRGEVLLAASGGGGGYTIGLWGDPDDDGDGDDGNEYYVEDTAGQPGGVSYNPAYFGYSPNSGGGSGWYGGSEGYGGLSYSNATAVTFNKMTYTPKVTEGVNSGHGSAIVTLIAKDIFSYGAITGLMYGDREVISLRYGDREVLGLGGGENVYDIGNKVTYICDGVTYTERVRVGADCLNPTTFTPDITGWNFLGWTTANNSTDILESLIMGEEEITLYAVYNCYAYQNGVANTAIGVGNPYIYSYDAREGNATYYITTANNMVGFTASVRCEEDEDGPVITARTPLLPTNGFDTVTCGFGYIKYTDWGGVGTSYNRVYGVKDGVYTKLLDSILQSSVTLNVSAYDYIVIELCYSSSGGTSGLDKNGFVGIGNVVFS